MRDHRSGLVDFVLESSSPILFGCLQGISPGRYSSMPSTSYGEWTASRAVALNEMAQAHAAVGGTQRGRRFATQHINTSYAVLLASQFQGFCRDLHFWTQVDAYDVDNRARRDMIEELNTWRNAIVHQNLEPARPGGTTTLVLSQVRRWRAACEHLAQSFDEVMRIHIHRLTGVLPW